MARLYSFVLSSSIFGFILLCPGSAPAQWTTPTIDGKISPSNEYGHNNQLNNAGATGQTWYMTWDATNLYVAMTNANLSEGAVIYLSAMPQFPPLSGSNANGSTQGFNYDGTDFSQLPFRANFVTYFKDGYREYRTSDGNNGWVGPTASFGSYASSGSGNVRELAIPWSAITGGGLPPAFYFFGYLTSSGGYVYGQAPADNTPGAFIGTSATYTRYYSIANTGNGTSTPPFSSEQPSGFSQAVKAAWRHDTFDPFYRSAEGAVTEGSQVTLRLRSGHFDLDGVTLRGYLFDTASGSTTGPVDTPMAFDQNITIGSTEYDVWKVVVTVPATPTIYYYKFKPFKNSTVGWYSDEYLDDNDNVNKDGTGAPSDSEPFDSFQITVYDPNFQTPAWLASANVYQIMPDRFRNGDSTNDYCVPQSTSGCPAFYGASNLIAYTSWNSRMCDPRNSTSSCYNNFNQFYGGDLRGIQNELDYLQSLGVDTLYLTPIFQARSYHRYDTDNYLHIDPALGGDAAFTSLEQEMDRRGMRVILDAVFNHASSDGLYFDRYNRYGGPAPNIGACLSLQSMWRSWFHFLDNNVPCGSSDYVGWFGFDSLPTFDHSNPQVQQFFFSGPGNVMQSWYNQGASGWRFDVAPDPNFPHSWWVGTRTYAKSYKSDGPLIGEIWPNASQWLAGDQLDSTMNYRFRKNVLGFARNAEWHDDNNNGTNDIPGLTPSQFDHALRAVRDDYPAPATRAMLDLIDSHDTNRALYVLTELGDTGLVQAKQRLELAALFQFTYVGAPMVMYGDEVAINSPSQSSSSNGPIGDPYTRAPYPWTDQSGDPSIYGPPDTSVESFYILLAHVRKQYPALATGSFTTLLTGDTQQPATAATTYAFARSQGSVTAIVALNNGGSSNTASIPVTPFYSDGAPLQDALTGATFAVSGGNVSVSLAARTGVVLLPYPASVDLVPPVASVALSPSPNANRWNNSVPVTAKLSGTDSGGSGVYELRYWVNDGLTNVAQSSTASLAFSSEGRSTVFLRALDHAGNISTLSSQPVNIDLTPPVVSVSRNPSTLWPPNGQSVSVTVSGAMTDNLSGVDPSSVNFAVLDSEGTVQPSGPVTLGAGGTYSFTVLLQASRQGTDPNSRQYTITVSSKDLAGNAGSASTVVTVPHDQSN
jgi:glycosidase